MIDDEENPIQAYTKLLRTGKLVARRVDRGESPILIEWLGVILLMALEDRIHLHINGELYVGDYTCFVKLADADGQRDWLNRVRERRGVEPSDQAPL
jgi:hypothetical protein